MKLAPWGTDCQLVSLAALLLLYSKEAGALTTHSWQLDCTIPQGPPAWLHSEHNRDAVLVCVHACV